MDEQERSQQWLKQSDYDFETAKSMFRVGKYIYCVFMCHLAVEKILKGLYLKSIHRDAPKTHRLLYLLETQELKIAGKHGDFLEMLDEVSVPTRYPQQLELLLEQYNKIRTQSILRMTKEVLKCLRKKL